MSSSGSGGSNSSSSNSGVGGGRCLTVKPTFYVWSVYYAFAVNNNAYY